MQIKVKIPLNIATKIKITIDEESFRKKLVDFIDQLENENYFNKELYNELLNMGINKNEFSNMINEIKVFASYDENHNEIGFPYENWIDRLLQVYEKKDL